MLIINLIDLNLNNTHKPHRTSAIGADLISFEKIDHTPERSPEGMVQVFNFSDRFFN